MSAPTVSGALRESTARLLQWLAEEALPLWSTVGVDRVRGGFVEQITPTGELIADVRRARLVGRQIYAFKTAGDLGWDGPSADLVEHGLAALLQHHLTDAHEVVARYRPSMRRGEGHFDLYDQAFVLFGLAHAYAQLRDAGLEARAVSLLTRLREEWAQPDRGFVEHQPPQAPLKANPHMHLLEASLAWTSVSHDRCWQALADEMVELCTARLIEKGTGAVHEYFDVNWRRIDESSVDVVEPGHQSEWAWLLMLWTAAGGQGEVAGAANRLIMIGETCGLDTRQQRLVNELNPDLTVRDERARLWPQTERIKALIGLLRMDSGSPETAQLTNALESSVKALLGYFEHPIRGSWWEHFDGSGDPVSEPARASSLYHIMGAAKELSAFTGLSLG